MTANVVNQKMTTVRTIKALRDHVDGWRRNGLKTGFAPTMGALHEGHLSLVRQSVATADRTVASIFVNPKQFAPHEDLDSYPRTEARDLALLEQAGCNLVYIPSPSEMYPANFQTSVSVGEIATGLCGSSRPHFFGGVATVVCKLLNQCRPDLAVFGEKDFQQLLVIRRMVADLDMDVSIVGAPIVREEDGLAMSSRNAYLSVEERQIAGRLNKIMSIACDRLAQKKPVVDVVREAMDDLTAAGFDRIDYIEVRSADNLRLMGPGPVSENARLFAAVILGKTRIIDNMAVN